MTTEQFDAAWAAFQAAHPGMKLDTSLHLFIAYQVMVLEETLRQVGKPPILIRESCR